MLRRPSVNFQIEGWTTTSSLFRRRWAASMWLFILSMPFIVRCYMLQMSGGKSAGRLRRLLRPGRQIKLSSNQFRMGVSSFGNSLDKASKARPNCQLAQKQTQLLFWYGRQNVIQHWSVAEERSRKTGTSNFSSDGIDIHEVLHVEILIEQSLSLPSQSRERSTLD